MSFRLGLENLLADTSLVSKLKTKRVALLAHPASVTQSLTHSIDALLEVGIKLSCAFGPQHGLKGDKQDNMIETQDEIDPFYKIPIFSLYGEVRRPTKQMLSEFDVLLIDLQDVGCRIYTFLTTLFYLLEDAEVADKEIIVLDRPNPIARMVEGSLLEESLHSFVGAAPVPMSHGLTLGEAANWYKNLKKLKTNLQVIKMSGFDVKSSWPKELAWVNPSPNMPKLQTANVYPGTVLFEGTLLSEGRGTTTPLEVFGCPNLQAREILNALLSEYSAWTQGLKMRTVYFEPTFHKFKGQLVSGLQLHSDPQFFDKQKIKPYRLVAAFLKLVRQFHPEVEIWRSPPYEYETVKRPFDLLSGSVFLREWIDNKSSTPQDLEKYLSKDENSFINNSKQFYLY